ncbi:serine/threonine-protein kinase 33-like [Haliotis asinina]|uniref:serine/threonine-protein kinase 33-like n=1 Tax=Haliotis asinina TaxID=109174 RepID=UPI0035319E6A
MTTTIPHIRIADDSAIKESYEVGKKLGQGSFGKVHEAQHRETKKSWAIKSINKEKAGSSALKLIEREVAILKRVHHPNIIQLNEVLESPTRMFLVMELCDGGEMADSLKDNKHFSEADTKTVIRRLASAISYLHKNDIVHRDIKLENILLSQNPDDPDDKLHIKVTDFGLSVVKGGAGHDNMMQDFCGTPMYMSPEIIDNKTYSQQCDVWAMGVIMYIMLCGYPPFRSNDEDSLYEIIKKGEVDFSEEPWPSISEEAKMCIQRMLKVDPAHRMSAAEVLDHAWLTGETHDSTKPVNVLEMMKEWGPELKKGGSCDDNPESAINGDSPDSVIKESASSTTDNTSHNAAPEATKGSSSDTRKGSGGGKRSSDSRSPPNSSTRPGAIGRGTKPAGGATKINPSIKPPATQTGTKPGNTGGRTTGGGTTIKKTAVNSNNTKTPSAYTRNQKK